MHMRVALVTGAGSGIGEAAARLLAARGHRVALLGRTRRNLDTVADQIFAEGGEALAIEADITNATAMRHAFETIDRRWGRLDTLFANAGVNGVWAPLVELEPEEWRSTIDINLTGTFLTVKYSIPLLARQGGSIVITSSVNGTRMFSNTGATAYASTKAAQVAFAKMMALELAKDRVRVNVICPGAIDTEIADNTRKRHVEAVREPVEYPEGEIPLTDGEPGAAVKVAELVAFLASDAASHITGTEMWIDGGQSLLQG